MNNWASDYSLCVNVCVGVCVCLSWLFCLLSSDPSQSDSNTKDFWFNMQALTSYLRKASDQNPSASYYNVDILKYQVSQPKSSREPYPDKITVVGRTHFPKCFTRQTSLRMKQKLYMSVGEWAVWKYKQNVFFFYFL